MSTRGAVYCSALLIGIEEGKEGENAGQESRSEAYKDILRGLFKKVAELPRKYDLYSGPIYCLPEEERSCAETAFPRSRALPEASRKTRWQVFAEKKGIKKNKNKRGGRIYDEATREYTPAFGRGSKADLDRQWLIEVKEGEDPYINRFPLLKKEKKRRIKENKSRELRNIRQRQKRQDAA